jgi:hypothetical protein
MGYGRLPEIAQPWHSPSSLAGPNPFQLVWTGAIQWREFPVAGCRGTMMSKGSAEISTPLFIEKEAAQYLTRSVSSLRRARKTGIGPKFVRIGRSIRYAKTELDNYILSCGMISGTSEVEGG